MTRAGLSPDRPATAPIVRVGRGRDPGWAKRHALWPVLGLLALLALVGCGSGGDSGSASDPAPGGDIGADAGRGDGSPSEDEQAADEVADGGADAVNDGDSLDDGDERAADASGDASGDADGDADGDAVDAGEEGDVGDGGGGDRADEVADGGADAVRPDPGIEVPDWVEVVGVVEALNVRSGPGSSFDRVAQIPPGETLRVLGGAESDDGEVWLLVVFGGDREGWVFTDYTGVIARPTPTPLPIPTPDPARPPGGGDGGADGTGSSDGSDDRDGGAEANGLRPGTELRVAASQGLNLRARPGLGATVLVELDNGDRVEATGRTDEVDGQGWTEVTVEGRTGWLASRFLAPVT